MFTNVHVCWPMLTEPGLLGVRADTVPVIRLALSRVPLFLGVQRASFGIQPSAKVVLTLVYRKLFW